MTQETADPVHFAVQVALYTGVRIGTLCGNDGALVRVTELKNLVTCDKCLILIEQQNKKAENIPSLRQAVWDRMDAKIAELRKEADVVVDETNAEIKRIITDCGKTVCLKCHGTGAVERLDSGYMKRFGLREWDGCENCGGSLDERGLGYSD